MADRLLTATTEVPAETEDNLQRKRYFLDPSPDTAPEEVRRDRLAHLFLMGLKTVKSRGKERSGV